MLLNLFLLTLISSVPQFSGPGLLPTYANIFAEDGSPSSDCRFPTSDFNTLERLAGFDIPIYTGPITSFSTATDSKQRIWVALATPEGEIFLYLSFDQGRSWHQSYSLILNRDISQIEMVAGQGDPSPIYVFYCTTDNFGDLWLLRVSETSWDTLPVVVGTDTIDDFSVTADKDTNYYLYCLYVNERRPGRNGGFIRSFDRGLTWEMPQDFWNCYDPHISFGTGSVLHCVWRYALNGREIHYAFNRYYGAPSRWSWLSVLSGKKEKCFDPVVIQNDTLPPWQATVWTAWCVARRDTENLDLVVRFSTDCGISWNEPINLGDRFIDEWWPSLYAGTYKVNLAYNCGAKKANDPTVVYSRYSLSYAPGVWTSPVKLNDPRVNASFEAARPRAVASGAIFSYYGKIYPEGVYFDTYLPFFQPTADSRELTAEGVQRLVRDFFDRAGRRVNTEKPPPGVYFCPTAKGIKKVVIY